MIPGTRWAWPVSMTRRVESPTRMAATDRRSMALTLAAAAASLCLMAWTTAWTLAQEGDLFRNQPKRFWEDVSLGVGCCLYGEFPVTHNPFMKVRDEGGALRYTEPRGSLAGAASAHGMRPWQFWRTAPFEHFERRVPPKPFPRFDDAGRPLLLCLLFRALGGVAPFALFWLGLLAVAPVVLWTAFEFAQAQRAAAGVMFLLILGLCPFLVDSLALPYAAIGFYLVGVLLLVPLAAYASLGQPTARGLLVRAGVAGLVFAVCTVSRGSGLLLLPGFALAFAVGAVRASRGSAAPPAGGGLLRRSVLLAGLTLLLFLLPYGLASAFVKRLTATSLTARGEARTIPQHHPVWYNVWIGLGDFDRTKGYVWEDGVASAVLVRHGGTAIGRSFLGPENEAILRDLMLADIRADPLWYAGILAKRVLATVTQWKLRAWGPLDGVAVAPRGHPNEGQIDAYYALTTTVDVVGAGPYRPEMPLPLLVLPSWMLVALAWRGRGAARVRARQSLLVLACLAAATLPLPVLITTAAGIETEAFAFAYLLGLAFVVEEAARWRRSP